MYINPSEYANRFPGALIDRSALIHKGVMIGTGASIGRGSLICHLARIGRGSLICHRARIGDSVRIGTYAWVGAGASIASGVEIPPYAHISDGDRITQNPFVILGVRFNVTGHEYGLSIGCQDHSPEWWAECDLEQFEGGRYKDYREQLDAAITLWHSMFEWIEED